jgi:hypothetical protein
VRRWFGNEVLSHAPGAADLNRVASGDAPQLWNHDPNAIIGTVESARITGSQGRAVVRFAKTPEAQKVVDLINDGIEAGVDTLREQEAQRMAEIRGIASKFNMGDADEHIRAGTSVAVYRGIALKRLNAHAASQRPIAGFDSNSFWRRR